MVKTRISTITRIMYFINTKMLTCGYRGIGKEWLVMEPVTKLCD